jgi:hypothetical protein
MSRQKKRRRSSHAGPPSGGRTPGWLIPAIGGVCALAIVIVAGVYYFASSGGESADDGVKRAVIVDQLQLTQPNEEFVSNARGLLAEAGYAVDYIPGDAVTVDLYRTLPEKDYEMVLLRVHAGITTEVDQATGEKTGTEYVSLFTGEPYDETKYSQEQLNRLGKARYTEDDDPLFGIGPEFVEKSMEGSFDDATILMMGCDGLRSQRTAEAFLNRGAGAFVSWSAPVSAPHTDTATETLLQKLLRDQLTLDEAVQNTAAEVGPDPSFDAELRILTG